MLLALLDPLLTVKAFMPGHARDFTWRFRGRSFDVARRASGARPADERFQSSQARATVDASMT